mgnify:CR=1 FL=1
MKRLKIILISISFFAFAFNVHGDNDCKNALYQANKLYETGKIQEAITRLESCISDEMSKEEISEAYKLLASAFSDLKKNEERDKYLLLLLKTTPNYQKSPNNDSKEITSAINQYTIRPLLQVGVKIGGNINNPIISESYSPVDFTQKYLPAVGYQFGLNLDYNLFEKTSLTLGLSVQGLSIKHEMIDKGNWKKNYNELMNTYNVAFGGLRYISLKKNLSAFGGIDFGLGILNMSKVNVKTERLSPKSIDQQSKDATLERNKLMPNVGAKLGLVFNVNDRGALIKLDWGFTAYTNTTVLKDKRVTDSEFIFRTKYINDDIKPQLMTLNITFSLPVAYKISK